MKYAEYEEFIKSKTPVVADEGFEPESPCPDWFKPHQVVCVDWAIRKGRAALFEAFGLGKTVAIATSQATQGNELLTSRERRNPSGSGF